MSNARPDSEDDERLRQLGYQPELARRMSGFSNFAISLSIICILAGGITSFQVGLNSAGGASLGLGWPLVGLFSLCVAATMAQVASAFPTAGGLYHWGSILGGRACGWYTAWFNLTGLITVLAAVNSGTFDFAVSALGWHLPEASAGWIRAGAIAALTLSHGLLNHFGIRLTTRLTDFSGWLILAVTTILAVALIVAAPHLEWSRLWTFTNFSGLPAEAPVFPRSSNLLWLFCLGFLLPAYTLTGFDASAHTAEETLQAAVNVPRGIVRSVWVSGLFGWALVVALLLALPDVAAGAAKGADVVPWVLRERLPAGLANVLLVGILLAQYLCGLAALTSASRMTFAFARDGGLPAARWLRQVQAGSQTPAVAVWTTAAFGVGLTLFVPYATIAAICAVLLYISYVLPVAAGFLAHGRSWQRMGPWHLGKWYRPLAALSVLGCLFLILIGVQPPNELAVKFIGGMLGVLTLFWFALERRRFTGPPQIGGASTRALR